MPIKIVPNKSLRMVHTICSGIVTFEEIQNYLQTTWLDPDIFGYNELFDFTDSDFTDITHAELISLVQMESKLYMLDESTRVAFLTHNQEHERVSAFFIAAKSVIPGPSRELESFDKRDNAMNWLSIEPITP